MRCDRGENVSEKRSELGLGKPPVSARVCEKYREHFNRQFLAHNVNPHPVIISTHDLARTQPYTSAALAANAGSTGPDGLSGIMCGLDALPWLWPPSHGARHAILRAA